MSIINRFPSGGGGVDKLKEWLTPLNLFNEVQENNTLAFVLIENDNLATGSFVFPYGNSVDGSSAGGMIYLKNGMFYSTYTFGGPESIDVVTIYNDDTGEEYVHIEFGANVTTFAEGWSARYFTLDL